MFSVVNIFPSYEWWCKLYCIQFSFGNLLHIYFLPVYLFYGSGSLFLHLTSHFPFLQGLILNSLLYYLQMKCFMYLIRFLCFNIPVALLKESVFRFNFLNPRTGFLGVSDLILYLYRPPLVILVGSRISSLPLFFLLPSSPACIRLHCTLMRTVDNWGSQSPVCRGDRESFSLLFSLFIVVIFNCSELRFLWFEYTWDLE